MEGPKLWLTLNFPEITMNYLWKQNFLNFKRLQIPWSLRSGFGQRKTRLLHSVTLQMEAWRVICGKDAVKRMTRKDLIIIENHNCFVFSKQGKLFSAWSELKYPWNLKSTLIRSDEGLKLETSPLKSFTGVIRSLSTRFITPNFHIWTSLFL